MTRFPRIRRRPDHWSSPHERARVRSAERLDGPLGLTEATWLEEHLATCAECAAIAAAYEADRSALRAMRGAQPEPPRDLWARTAAAIEQESAALGRGGAPARRAGRRVPVGALSGVAVIAVVVGVSTLSTGLLGSGGSIENFRAEGETPAQEAAGAPSAETGGGGPVGAAEPTPIAVGAGGVAWLQSRGDGTFAYNAATVDEVCPAEAKEDCATFADAGASRLTFDATPETIIASPKGSEAVVVSRDATGAQRVVVVALPDSTDVDTLASAAPSGGETPGVEPSASASASASTSPLASDGGTASLAPSATSEPTEVPIESAPAASQPPESSVGPSEEPSPPETASPSPEATLARTMSLASGVEVVGSSAAFSPDGTWFAFTARPPDGSTGPDVYVWRVGDAEAQRLTTDGGSTFASWSGDEVIVSRSAERDTTASPDGGGGDTSAGQDGTPTSLAIDPATGSATEVVIDQTWRPAVDPTERWAVTFVGSLASDGCDGCWKPNTGQLELRPWSPTGEAGGSTGTVLADTGGDFDVRWDDSGEWFAVWIADPNYGTFGRLTLYRIDPTTGAIDQPEGSPIDVLSLPGFSIGEGRLAWATPPGQGGEGSRVQVVAWTDEGVGQVETAPGEELVLVR